LWSGSYVVVALVALSARAIRWLRASYVVVVELATAAWVAWWNAERLHGACGDIPPAEFEAAYHHRLPAATEAA